MKPNASDFKVEFEGRGGSALFSSRLPIEVLAHFLVLAPAVSKVEKQLGREINYTAYSREEVATCLGEEGNFLHEVFIGPRTLLVGDTDDGLFRAA